jgi:Carboxypeptidase regulatory-like domain
MSNLHYTHCIFQRVTDSFSIYKVALFVALAVAQSSVLKSATVVAMQRNGVLYGNITDELGAVIINAKVTLVTSGDVELVTLTTSRGSFVFNKLNLGEAYILRISAPGFALRETNIIMSQSRQKVDLTLQVAPTHDEVKITPESGGGVDLDNTAGAIILSDKELDSLPDDAEGLITVLKAMAGNSAGVLGGGLYVDGFTSDRVPPKSSIREVRINNDPYSAEYDRPGYGRIEIFTKAGVDKIHGEAHFSFNDETLNSRNPLVLTRAPYQTRVYGGSISGPIVTNKASYYVYAERIEINDNAIVNAQTVSSDLKPKHINRSFIAPRRFIGLYPRLEYQLNSNNLLSARYVYKRWLDDNQGTGEFSLSSQAYATTTEWDSMHTTWQSIVSQHLANEIRFQTSRQIRRVMSSHVDPTILVLDGFIDGGSQFGTSASDDSRYELHSYTTGVHGNHTLRFGGRVRLIDINDSSRQNYNGTYIFAGGTAPLLDGNNRIVYDTITGQALFEQITSLERYRRTLLFQRMGLPQEEARWLGGGATQFSVVSGEPEIEIRQWDIGIFLQDNWRIRPNMTLGYGIRYETQNNIHSPLNFAPRIGFAWSPHTKTQKGSKMVIRGGAGIFYDRISEALVMNSLRFSDRRQRRYITVDPLSLDAFPLAPSFDMLDLNNRNESITRLADDIRLPYMLQVSLGINTELPGGIIASTTFILSRALHTLRSRNINAPINGIPPLGDNSNVFVYETSGRSNQAQLLLNVNKRLGKMITLFGTYTLNRAMSDTDGAHYFPADSYDMSREYSRASTDIRHSFYCGTSVSTLWGVSLFPTVFITSGRPFNITTGRDTNRDTIFQERPSFAGQKDGIITTDYGIFNLIPDAGQSIIPRNYGRGPSNIVMNLRVSKSFILNDKNVQAKQSAGSTRRNDSRYALSLSIDAINILNHTNYGVPIGNLSSPFFGQSTALAGGGKGGNRTIRGQLRFSF